MARLPLSLFRPARPTLFASVAVAAALTAVAGGVWMASSGTPRPAGPRAVAGLEPNSAALLELPAARAASVGPTLRIGPSFLGVAVPQTGSQAAAGAPAAPVQPGGGPAVQPPALPPPPSPPPGDPDPDPLTELLRAIDNTFGGLAGFTGSTIVPAAGTDGESDSLGTDDVADVSGVAGVQPLSTSITP